jgi:hypothetical protein
MNLYIKSMMEACQQWLDGGHILHIATSKTPSPTALISAQDTMQAIPLLLGG